MDPVTATKTAEFLQSSGPYGFIMCCFVVIGFLWRDNVKLRGLFTESQENRFKDVTALAEKTAKGLADSSHTAAAQATATDLSNVTQRQMFDFVKMLPAAIETLSRQVADNGNKIDRIADRMDRGDR